MATKQALCNVTVPAGSDLSAKQYHFMTVNSSGQLAAAGSAVAIDGVLQNKPSAAGAAGTLAVSGISKVYAGGTVTAGDAVTPDSAGKAVTASATGAVVAGTAMVSGVSGDVIEILLNPQQEPVA